MKPILLFLIFSVGVIYHVSAQNPLVKMWDKRFGGNLAEQLESFQQTTDGGYILGGWSASGISGDKSQSTWGDIDYWIVKTDSLGAKQWDKDFGGADGDQFEFIQQTYDRGYILGGYSSSGISGDKTQPVWGGNAHGDYWIVKTDSLGNKQWDKDYGGTGEDFLQSVQQTSDGGYILGGSSFSGISGDKTQDTWGGSWDYWIVKIDSLGNKEWDKDFGGTNVDELFSLKQTSDSGYVLGGLSNSGIGGDKTQANWGSTDYWVVKIDSLGNKEWDKSFGGTSWDQLYSLDLTSDGGYILGGLSNSGISGDKTQPTWGLTPDYWIIKIDSLGNKEWDKDFGGINFEEIFGNISQTSDRGYLIAGSSSSNISGDKTENNLDTKQSWVIKTDSLGNKQWDKTLHTNGPYTDESGFATQTKDGCYVFANWTSGGIAGDKTQPLWGGVWYDYWIIKFCDSTILQSLFSAPTFLCPGTCTDFLNLSFSATSYQWFFSGAAPDTSTLINPTNICYSNPGSYDVQLIATNANGSDTLFLTNYITVYPTPPPQSITQSGDTLIANAGATSYQWYFNTNIITGATNYFYVAPSSGDYNVVATDVNGCEVEAAVFNVTASLQSTADSQQLVVFPNPVEDKLTMQDEKFTIGTALEISIYNLVGEKILMATNCLPIAIGIRTVDCRLLPSGIYYLEITNGAKIFHAKFVKE